MVEPLIDFIVASLMKVRFWVILCPINFVGRGLHSSTFQLNLSRF